MCFDRKISLRQRDRGIHMETKAFLSIARTYKRNETPGAVIQ